MQRTVQQPFLIKHSFLSDQFWDWIESSIHNTPKDGWIQSQNNYLIFLTLLTWCSQACLTLRSGWQQLECSRTMQFGITQQFPKESFQNTYCHHMNILPASDIHF
jgi:hypothetical protein